MHSHTHTQVVAAERFVPRSALKPRPYPAAPKSFPPGPKPLTPPNPLNPLNSLLPGVIALLAQRVLPLLLRLVDVRHGDGWVDNSVVNDAGVAAAETMDGIEHDAFCVATLTHSVRAGLQTVRRCQGAGELNDYLGLTDGDGGGELGGQDSFPG